MKLLSVTTTKFADMGFSLVLCKDDKNKNYLLVESNNKYEFISIGEYALETYKSIHDLISKGELTLSSILGVISVGAVVGQDSIIQKLLLKQVVQAISEY